MPFETDLLIEKSRSLPADESSINCEVCVFSGEDAARTAFDQVKRRLKDVNEWNSRSGFSTYELFDESGRPLSSDTMQNGQFMKITLTGSGKSDWVRVERIYETKGEIVITVKPTYDPTASPQQTGEISHFFVADARNNFCAVRADRKVSVYVVGLNERLNSGHTSGLIETARNAAVANLGYYLGIQKAEWNKFCSSMLEGLGGESE